MAIYCGLCINSRSLYYATTDFRSGLTIISANERLQVNVADGRTDDEHNGHRAWFYTGGKQP